MFLAWALKGTSFFTVHIITVFSERKSKKNERNVKKNRNHVRIEKNCARGNGEATSAGKIF